jgi:pyruvate/2-oxoglutarate dehydrogenase complex dihydrolipoamide acyltransferase (E2) component
MANAFEALVSAAANQAQQVNGRPEAEPEAAPEPARAGKPTTTPKPAAAAPPTAASEPSPAAAPALRLTTLFGARVPFRPREQEKLVNLCAEVPKSLREAVRWWASALDLEMQELVRLAVEEKLRRLADENPTE